VTEVTVNANFFKGRLFINVTCQKCSVAIYLAPRFPQAGVIEPL
jgi:hypothetical protein